MAQHLRIFLTNILNFIRGNDQQQSTEKTFLFLTRNFELKIIEIGKR